METTSSIIDRPFRIIAYSDVPAIGGAKISIPIS